MAQVDYMNSNTGIPEPVNYLGVFSAPPPEIYHSKTYIQTRHASSARHVYLTREQYFIRSIMHSTFDDLEKAGPANETATRSRSSPITTPLCRLPGPDA
ncbi:uncharacterized protein PAC_18053 [Phialocephala subalpina]|uniref:Uncharacterized protein n=1 Tax=Phialocephala subalpina TaxID=576137 RepID=A0A1L7XSY9_9HELO|nr:uncharacterized protein PAC_18053 [Phialocephala subalpina]